MGGVRGNGVSTSSARTQQSELALNAVGVRRADVGDGEEVAAGQLGERSRRGSPLRVKGGRREQFNALIDLVRWMVRSEDLRKF